MSQFIRICSFLRLNTIPLHGESTFWLPVNLLVHSSIAFTFSLWEQGCCHCMCATGLQVLACSSFESVPTRGLLDRVAILC